MRMVPLLSNTPATWLQVFNGRAALELAVYWVPFAPNTQNCGPVLLAVLQRDMPIYWVPPVPTLAVVEKSKNRTQSVKRVGNTQPSIVKSPPIWALAGTSYQQCGMISVSCPIQRVEVPEIVSPRVRDWEAPIAPLSLMYCMFPFCVRL